MHATKNLEFVAREASQILGGKSYLRSGPGARVERISREVRVLAIGGGSEEILLDLAARQAKLWICCWEIEIFRIYMIFCG